MHLLHVGHIAFRPESGTPYHLSVALAQHVPVTYLNPPLSFSRWFYLKRQPFSRDRGVKVLSPVLPGELRFLPRRQRQAPLHYLALLLTMPCIKSLRRQCTVLWVSNSALAVPLYRWLRPTLTCYHRLDDFGAMDPALKPLEHTLEEIADIIYVVSPHLQAQHRARGREAHLLPNGVDLSLFAKALDCQTSVPADLAVIPAPRIGFIGCLTNKWIDFDLMFAAATQRPDWSFVLIGPKVSWKPAGVPPNVYLLGARPYTQLPSYLKGLDVCLVPFKQNAITDGASPLKLYEYLAAGRAVVSTPVPDLPTFEGVVWCAHDSAGFVSAIEEALSVAHDPHEQRRRLDAVAPHSWDARAQTAMAHLRQVMGIE
jgi:UDP-galactopyranose mutase